MTRDASTLDDVFAGGRNGRRGGCFICRDETAAFVQINIYEVEDGVRKRGGRSKSTSRSFCSRHAAEAAEVYVALHAKLDEELS